MESIFKICLALGEVEGGKTSIFDVIFSKMLNSKLFVAIRADAVLNVKLAEHFIK